MNYPLADHVDHIWEKVGRCVYCSCGIRLYQGDVPKDKRAFAEELDRVIAAAIAKSESTHT